ncbi:phosphomannomutase/phosphoglucomutase [Hydrogenovibrio halophilus]|uniref:phosphomannomutase/phosphoglucomutase n=1 Tax=Hydrogenovibrio halophilus TaxID=373391 RepID=UPI000362BA8C|nr:phosphomannomutase/phosphoglucomutase [Hydrogenovibrio halophilus]
MSALIDPSIFRTYDIRGVVDQTLTETAVSAIARAFAQSLRESGETHVVVGRDGRLSGPRFARLMIEGLSGEGLAVIDLGEVTTSMVYFAREILPNVRSCIAITGSHNPPDYNGIKLVAGGVTLYGEHIQAIRQRIETNAQTADSTQITRPGQKAMTPGPVQSLDIFPAYCQRIVDDVALNRPLKVVLDAGNGVAGRFAPVVFRALGCEVVELFCDVDGRFPNHHPDPAKAANLADLARAVVAQKADLGLAFDGDGDRCGVVDDTGQSLYADRQLMLYARDVLTRQPGAEILYDIKCSALVARDIEAHGGRATMWKTGHSYMKAKMKASGAALGGEVSGHMFFKERWYGFDDGIYTAARMAEIVAAQKRTAAELFATLPDACNTPEIDLPFAEGEHYSFMDKVRETAGRSDWLSGASLFTLDGIRADFDDGWGLIRPSNTAPLITLRFEGDTPQALARIQARFRGLIQQVDPALMLPF